MRKLRVFIASPGDVAEERDLVSLIVEELRRNVARLASVELETVRWETHAWPGVGDDAQDVINREIGDYDVFVGIMWKRFGTRTKRAPSGTAEEFDRAYQYFTAYARPKIMFYFRSKPFFTADPSELQQFRKVVEFRRRLEKVGVLFWEYVEPIEFERRFREHLTNQIVELSPAGIRIQAEIEGPSIYLSYKRQDLERVEPIYEALKAEGFTPWIDVRDILPGKNWVAEIADAIRSADFFISFVSRYSVDKQVRSVTDFSVKSEIDIALERIAEVERGEPDVTLDPGCYMIPARLDPVQPPPKIAQFQWVDLFEPKGPEVLIATIRSIWRRRAAGK